MQTQQDPVVPQGLGQFQRKYQPFGCNNKPHLAAITLNKCPTFNRPQNYAFACYLDYSFIKHKDTQMWLPTV